MPPHEFATLLTEQTPHHFHLRRNHTTEADQTLEQSDEEREERTESLLVTWRKKDPGRGSRTSCVARHLPEMSWVHVIHVLEALYSWGFGRWRKGRFKNGGACVARPVSDTCPPAGTRTRPASVVTLVGNDWVGCLFGDFCLKPDSTDGAYH